jgi:hypothetical protein
MHLASISMTDKHPPKHRSGDEDEANTQGTPDGNVEADTASGGAPDS